MKRNINKNVKESTINKIDCTDLINKMGEKVNINF